MQIQRSLKKALKNSATVTGLDLRQEKPSILFPEIVQFVNLEFIDFSNCTSLDWADACLKLANLPKLISIKAFGAEAKKLPDEFGLLKKLKTIDFSSNKELALLPETFSELVELEEINLHGCGLESLPQTPWHFLNLHTLIISANKLQNIPENFFDGLPNLIHVSINDNQLAKIPESICSLNKLQTLFAGGNQFNALPENFAALTHLETLWLDSCPEINYEEELQKIKDLPIKNLTLLGNKLSELPRPFSDFRYLEVLNINSNNLVNTWVLIGQLCHLPLKELDVRFTGCEVIAIEDVQANIPTVQKVFFDTRTTEQYSDDVYSWVAGHYEMPDRERVEITIITDIHEYLKLISGEQTEITFAGNLRQLRPNMLRAQTVYKNKAYHAVIAIKNIVTSNQFASVTDDPEMKTETIANIYLDNVIERDNVDFLR